MELAEGILDRPLLVYVAGGALGPVKDFKQWDASHAEDAAWVRPRTILPRPADLLT